MTLPPALHKFLEKTSLACCWGFAGLLILLHGACEQSPVYEEYLQVEEKGWHQDSTAEFQVEIADTSRPYVVQFNLRANDQYPYSNLYLFREVSSAADLEYRDTAQIILANRYGEWLGDGIGDLKTFQRPFRNQPLLFNEPGVYTFSFTQAMRETRLEGVKSVGLTIYPYRNESEEKSKED